MIRTGFDSEKYLTMQSARIEERIREFGGKLYLEFGGKLFDDYHASRVLPVFAPDNKIKMLEKLRDRAEIVIVISAQDIAKNKVREDLGITYEADVLRLIDIFRSYGLYVGSVVLTRYSEENEPAVRFRDRLIRLGMPVYRHYPIPGYPNQVLQIVSEEGYGKNEYIETSRNLVVITAPGPGSGKMATCLSQLYHDSVRGIPSGYAKYETFPIWNLPLMHPVNVAYEAATADLDDVNMIDPFHLEAYGESAVNYNRDVEIFPVLNAVFEKLMGHSPYRSPTDMGVNMAGYCISDDEACCEAARAEILRRYYKALVSEIKHHRDSRESDKIVRLMQTLSLSPEDRSVVRLARQVAEEKGCPAAAIELPDGRLVSGRTGDLFGCSAAMILNALKTLAGIDDGVKLIARSCIEPVQELKTRYLGCRNPRLHVDEMLVALSSAASENPMARLAMEQLRQLRGCEVHATVILSHIDEKMFRMLGVNLTTEPVYRDKTLYHE